MATSVAFSIPAIFTETVFGRRGMGYGVSEGPANIGPAIFHSPLPETIGWQA